MTPMQRARCKGDIEANAGELVALYVRKDDAEMLGAISDYLRARGWTYRRIINAMKEHAPDLTEMDYDDAVVEAE